MLLPYGDDLKELLSSSTEKLLKELDEIHNKKQLSSESQTFLKRLIQGGTQQVFEFLHDRIEPPNVTTLMSNSENLRRVLKEADVVVSSVLIPGGRSPTMIRKEHLKTMKKGAVIVDVAIDQGGSTETSRPTSHRDPIYDVDGIIHYCVSNMPGAMPMTSTIALTNATLPYIQKIANDGWQNASRFDPSIARGINIASGLVTHRKIAQAFDLKYRDWRVLL